MPRRADWSSKEMMVAQERADEIGLDPRLFEALVHNAGDDEMWARAMKDPREILGERGIELPDELGVEAFEGSHGKPTPDFEMYRIVLTNCRTYWVRKEDGAGFEKVEICRGFVIFTNPIPGGPRGRG